MQRQRESAWLLDFYRRNFDLSASSVAAAPWMRSPQNRNSAVAIAATSIKAQALRKICAG
jgi:hypothetical protein